MLLTRNVVVLLIFVGAFANEHTPGIPNVDYILDNLLKQQWDPDEARCRVRIFDILENVKNSTLWATWVWNSMEQSPTGTFFGARYHMGNYDQCLRPPWLASHPELRTQYCLADIEMHKDGVKTMVQVTDPYVRAEDYYLDTKSLLGRSFSYMAYGICLPAGCQSKSAEKLVKAIMSTGYLRAAKHADVSIHHCEEAGVPHHYPKGFYIYILTITALLFIVVVSTYYVSKYPAIASTNSFVNHVAKSYDLRKNWDALSKHTGGDLEFLNGFRFLSAITIAFFHRTALIAVTSTSNGLDLERIVTNGIFLARGDMLTDFFLAISALLLGRNITMLDVTKPYYLLKYILARYFRLIGALAVCIMYMVHVSMHTDDGPLYPKLAGFEKQNCEKNWWLNLLLVGNYFNVSEMCFPGTWQVCCDFQLYVGTLVLLYVYRKSPRVGKVVVAAVVVVGFLCPAISAYTYNFPAVGSLNIGLDLNVRKSPYIMYGYLPTHNRMGAYMAGLAVGYFMSFYKPKDHKKIWSRTISFLGICASLGLIWAVFMVGSFCYHYRVYGLMASVFMIFDRVIFACGVLGVVVICTYGNVPFVDTILGWSVFGKLCKVSYGLYLIHQVLQLRSIVSLRSHFKIHLFDIFTESLGQVGASLVLSLAMCLLVEMPLTNIARPYFDFRSTKTAECEVIKYEDKQKLCNKQKTK